MLTRKNVLIIAGTCVFLWGLIIVSCSAVMAQTTNSEILSANQAIAIAGGGSGYTGGTQRNRIINNPDVAVGSAISTANCIIAVGGGGSGGGVGLVIQFGMRDDECMVLRRAEAARTLGGNGEAIEIMCDGIPQYRQMRARVGRPCMVDQAPPPMAPAYNAGAPVAQQVSAPPAQQAARVRPDWCDTASPSERRRHAACL
jgi:hypothetical protein